MDKGDLAGGCWGDEEGSIWWKGLGQEYGERNLWVVGKGSGQEHD
jgi:hypothetical protein